MNRNPKILIVIAAAVVAAIAFVAGRESASVDAQRIAAPRIAPVPADDWNEQQQAIMQVLAQTGRDYNVFTTMLNHPDLMQDWLVFGQHVLQTNSLPARERELLILRIGWLCQSEYEWSRHVPIGKAAGLTDAEILRITDGPDAEGWSANDAALLRAADELDADAFISDQTWAALEQQYSTEQLMDIVFTVGQYNMVSMALNSFGVQLDPDVTGFPE